MTIPIKALIYLALLVVLINAQCTRRTSDTVPSAGDFDYVEPAEKIGRGFSEVVLPYNQPILDYFVGEWERVDCPHELDGLLAWEDASTWASTLGHAPTGADDVITLPVGQKVLIRGCSLDGVVNDVENPFGTIVVPPSSSLIFDDSDIELHVKEIKVEGSLEIGGEQCRLYSNVKIVFHGSKADSSIDNLDETIPSKGIKVKGGTLEMHGKQFHPTWTRLTAMVAENDDIIFLQDAVNWEVGQEILIVTSKWLDCPEEYQEAWCKPCYSWQTCDSAPHENEIRTITAIDNENGVIQLDSPLTFEHYAGTEYQTEVALLSRRIQIEGTDSGDQYGAHVMVAGDTGEMRISGASCTNCGQLNVLGRYPFHFHLMGDGPNTENSFFQDSSVIHSNFRSFVIHGTNNTLVSRNVAYDVWGMSIYLEDGVEENNVIEYNLAAHTHPILAPANGNGGQGGESFIGRIDRILPADASAAGYYVSNSYNIFLGNAASGGWSGFAFPNIPYPINDHQGLDYGSNNPMQRPNMENGFVGNTAHSSGFYWSAHGACIYTGAWLEWNEGLGKLSYMSGREERQTQDSDASPRWMEFQDTKTWLCNRGINHWGDRAVIQYYESHDNLRSAVLFGEAAMKYTLVNARSGNTKGIEQQNFRGFRQGFEFYDTWVKTMLSYVTFRNFNSPNQYVTDRVISYMTHSDQFLPQGINSVRGIKFENCDPMAKLAIPNCGDVCGDTRETMSARMASVYDFDGSLSETNVPSIIGSHLSWWDVSDSSCDFLDNYNVWRCDWNSHRKVVYFQINIPGMYQGCDNNNPLRVTSETCFQYGQSTAYTVGYISQWGDSSKKIDLSSWSGVTGMSNIGWYYRAPWGAPSRFNIGNSLQIPRGHFVVFAVRYPAAAEFTVRMISNWWAGSGATYDPLPMLQNKADILVPTESLNSPSEFTCSGSWWDFCTNTGGVGPAWHFDGEYLYLRIVNFLCYNANGRNGCENNFYEIDEMKLWDITGAFSLDVQVNCPGCTVAQTYSGVTYWDVADVNNLSWNVIEEEVPVFTGGLDTIRDIFTDPTDAYTRSTISSGTGSSQTSSSSSTLDTGDGLPETLETELNVANPLATFVFIVLLAMSL